MRLPLGRRAFAATALFKFHCLTRFPKPRGSHLVIFVLFSQNVIWLTSIGDDREAILRRKDCGSFPSIKCRKYQDLVSSFMCHLLAFTLSNIFY